MKQIWAPWRLEYILTPPKEECIFCNKTEGSFDETSLILFQDDLFGVMLNRYPYNNGHLLIYPLRHIPSLDNLASEETASIFAIIKRSTSILNEVLKPQGFNIGANIGKAAGAGIDSHLHFHVVPRWTGDVNFMPVVGDVKVMPEHIEASYRKLASHFDRLHCA